MINDRKVRTHITKESFYHFLHFYFAHYVKYPTADFQAEMITLLQRSPKDLYVVAFRGSGKSTIVTTIYPIWAIMGLQQKKFVLIFCETKAQAKQHMMNIRKELEDNDLLKKDLGPFKETSEEWGSHSIVFSKSGARITVASAEQSIRGIRHHQYRPDLIICDDIEDIPSTRTQESRDKKYNWLRGEVIPAGDTNTRLIVVGNLLHEDSLLMRMKDDIEHGRADGIFKTYPLVDEDGICLWPGKYPNEEAIEAERKKTGNENAWQREFMLKVVSEEDQVVHREWIQHYDDIPTTPHRWTKVGIDLAISLKTSADYTAMVAATLVGNGEKAKLYVHPFPVNKRMDFPATVDMAKQLVSTANVRGVIELLIEEVAYQQAFVQHMQASWYKARGIRVMHDKRSRLAVISHLIKNGNILFPKRGAEQLISQIIGFGVEKHDDLMDAFVLVATEAMNSMKKGRFNGRVIERLDRI